MAAPVPPATAVAHLVQAVEMILHAFDGNILAILDALRFEHLTEGALALFGNQAVLCRVMLWRQQGITLLSL
jgi:hypothetical protein